MSNGRIVLLIFNQFELFTVHRASVMIVIIIIESMILIIMISTIFITAPTSTAEFARRLAEEQLQLHRMLLLAAVQLEGERCLGQKPGLQPLSTQRPLHHPVLRLASAQNTTTQAVNTDWMSVFLLALNRTLLWILF